MAQSGAGPLKRWPWWLGGAALVLAALLGADRLWPPPDGAGLTHSQEIQARGGDTLGLYLTPDGYWRLPLDLAGLDPRFPRLLLAYEDRRFYQHPGVDPLALARALGQALGQGRFVSGGSTLSMQTARLLNPQPRTLGVKLQEMGRAWQLERRLDKDQILALYLTLAPYGGNLQGIRAASLFYLGKEPRFLSLAEAALLVALPQSPERRRPDRHPLAARQARDLVLERLARAGVVSPEEARRAMAEPLVAQRRPAPRLAPHLGERLRRIYPDAARLRTSLDGRLQRQLEGLLARHQQAQADGIGLAALVLDNGTGKVRAYVGSGDYFSRRFPGQVDMARAVRSPGSTLKPFVYGLAFEHGLIHPDTLIGDRPGPVEGYAPLNFDRLFRGELRARDALRASRNLPAVQILSRVGPERLVRLLERGEARVRLPKGVARPGLPIALGGVGIRLEDLTRLYAALANRGLALPIQWLEETPPSAGVTILSPVATWYLTDILVGSSLPPGFVLGGRRLAFKTGTSYGFRDAWAIGYDAQHSVGVWLGRPDGGYTHGLTGLQAAVPVLMEVFDLLPRAGVEPLLRAPPPGVLRVTTQELPPALRRFSLAPATGPVQPQGPRILYPPDGSQVELAPGRDLLVEAQGGEPPFHWLVDGRYLTSTGDQRRLAWRPASGTTQLTLLDQQGRAHSVRVVIRGL